MSTPLQQKTAYASGKILVLILFWPLFGWLGDLNIEERDQQNVFERAATWTSVFFHVVGAVSISLFVSPLWGLTWGIFSAIIFSRRLGARKGLALSLSNIVSFLNMRVAGAGAAVAVLGQFLPVWKIIGAAGVVVVIVAFAVGARECTNTNLAEHALYYRWANRLKNIFEVPEAVFLEQAGLTAFGTGLVIDRVPDDVRKKFATLGASGIDANIAGIDPNLELAPESTHDRIVIQPASNETLSRRKSLAESGGLFTGFGEAPAEPLSAVAFATPHAAPAQEQGKPLVITVEDL